MAVEVEELLSQARDAMTVKRVWQRSHHGPGQHECGRAADPAARRGQRLRLGDHQGKDEEHRGHDEEVKGIDSAALIAIRRVRRTPTLGGDETCA